MTTDGTNCGTAPGETPRIARRVISREMVEWAGQGVSGRSAIRFRKPGCAVVVFGPPESREMPLEEEEEEEEKKEELEEEKEELEADGPPFRRGHAPPPSLPPPSFLASYSSRFS